MQKIKELLKSPEVQISIAVGISIIIMAYFSKRILPEKISYLQLAIPPFIGTIFEAVKQKYKDSRIATTWYWITAILVATAIIIVIHA